MDIDSRPIRGWIKLGDGQRVNFPEICPFSGLKANTYKEYVVTNTSLLWILLRFVQIGQYMTIPVPFHENGVRELRKRRNKAILIGLGVGFIVAILAMVLSVYLMVESDSRRGYDLAMIIGGISFVGSLILGPVLFLYQEHRKSAPLYFRKKGKQLWVKVRNRDYRKMFFAINELNVVEDSGRNEDVIDD